MQAYKIMHGLWGTGQTMFTKYIVVEDDDVDVHNTCEGLFRLCANTDPPRDSIFTKGPADVLDHATSEFAIGSKSPEPRAFTQGHADRRRTQETFAQS